MHRSESQAYTVPLLCLQYCILEDVFMYYIIIQFVIYIYMILPSFVSFTVHKCLWTNLMYPNVPFIPMWCCKKQNTQQHVQQGILVKVKIEEDDYSNRTYSNLVRLKLHMYCTHEGNMVLIHDIHHTNIKLVHFFTYF